LKKLEIGNEFETKDVYNSSNIYQKADLIDGNSITKTITHNCCNSVEGMCEKVNPDICPTISQKVSSGVNIRSQLPAVAQWKNNKKRGLKGQKANNIKRKKFNIFV
jgi:hypothetical protein